MRSHQRRALVPLFAASISVLCGAGLLQAAGSLSVSRTATTLTVTSAGVFEIVFDQTWGGAITVWYDLRNDPGRTTNLVSTANDQGKLFSYKYTSATNYGSFRDDLTVPHSEHQFVLLSSTPSVVELLIAGHMHQLVAMPDDAEGLGTVVRHRWTIYPNGALYLDFNRTRKAGAAPLTVTNERIKLVADYSTSWITATESEDPMVGTALGGDDFIMLHAENAGSDSHYADPVLGSYQDLIDLAPSLTDQSNSAPTDNQKVRWSNDASHAMAAGSTLNAKFVLRLASGLVGRNDAAPYVAGFRNPDLLSFTTGSAWSDTNENTGAGDHFNEAQGVYPVDFNPAAGLSLAVDGGTNRRFNPPLKVRQWRSATTPSIVTFSGGLNTWKVTDQTGIGIPQDDTTSNGETQRTLLKAPFITRSGSEIRMRLRANTSVAADVSNFHIAEADADDRNVVDSTWTQVTFAGATAITIAPGGTLWSDWVSFNLDETKTYSLTAFMGSPNGTAEWVGSGVQKYIRVGVDDSNTLDWSALALSPSDRIDLVEEIEVRGTLSLATGADFVSSLKPVSDADFASDVLFHTTLENFAAVTTPDVGDGTGAAQNTMTYVAGRYGSGALFNANSDRIEWRPVGGAVQNVELDRGRIEFWCQPNYNSTDATLHYFFDLDNDGVAGGVRIYLRKETTNDLTVGVQDVTGTNRGISIPAANYQWTAGDWVHLAMDWDSTDPTDNVNVYMNGVELVPTATNNVTFTMEPENPLGLFRLGNRVAGGPAANGNVVLDEFTLYSSPTTPTQLADGGFQASASEYLNRGNNNFTLAFTPVNALTRSGRYLFFGSDSKFRGLNVSLTTKGAGAGLNLQWQYWNGSAWANLETVAGFTDQTNHLTADGTVFWTADPTGWAPYSVNGGPDLYYVRVYLAAGSYTTSPVEGVIRTDILNFLYCGDLTSDNQVFTFAVPKPTAVELTSFFATGVPGGVRLDWQTASELNNLGFHIYRSLSPGGPFERITSSLIAGLGTSPVGKSYSYIDSGLEPGKIYYYKLEDVETSGRTKLHGPVSATPLNEAEPGPGPAGRETYGEPLRNRLDLLPSSDGGWTVRLITAGFSAERTEAGVALDFPESVVPDRPGAPQIPLRELLVPLRAGGSLRITDLAEDKELLAGFDLAPSTRAGVRASQRGVVAAGRERAPRGPLYRRPDFLPERQAEIAGVEVQGLEKYVRLRLAPLRWNPTTGQLAWSRTLEVRLAPAGADRQDRVVARNRVLRLPRRDRSVRPGAVIARLTITSEGLYRISARDLARAGLAGNDLAQLWLSYCGEPVASRLASEAEGPALYFYALADRNPHDRDTVYELLRSAAPLRMSTAVSPPTTESASFLSGEARFEQNRYYQAGLLEAEDLWFWDLLLAPQEKPFSFALDGLASAAADGRLTVDLQAATDFEPAADHHLRARLNGVPVAEASWDGRKPYRLDAVLPAGALRSGENVLELANLGDTGAPYSMVFLNRFSITYPRSLQASADRVSGALDREAGVELIGFSARPLPALDLREPDRPRVLPGRVDFAPDGSFRMSLSAPAGTRLFSTSGAGTPVITRASLGQLRSRKSFPRYLAVGPRVFAASVQPLLALRRERGLSAGFFSTEDIYADFGFGERSPEAIRDFVVHAFHQSQGAVEYLLLLGDASYDFKDLLGQGDRNFLPALIRRTRFLWTASDNAFATVNGSDELPDLKVGRLPAASAAELQAMVDKILAYERAHFTEEGPVVFIADNADAAGNFEQDAERLAREFFADRNPSRLYLSREGTEGLRGLISRALDDGSSLVTYIGHGGIQLWAQENVWNSADVAALAPQPRQPLVLAVNCLNGYFHFPYFDSLGESFLKTPEKGAIAVVAPSGLSLDEPAQQLVRYFFEELKANRELGQAFLNARARYAREGLDPDLLLIYSLFGDPALRLK